MFMTEAQLQEALDKSPSDFRVTTAEMEGRIAGEAYHIHGATTLCELTLDNGYTVWGQSACVDPNNFNKDIGETISRKNAFALLWPLFGFLLAEKLMWLEQQKKELGLS
jgi:hypothetical protein